MLSLSTTDDVAIAVKENASCVESMDNNLCFLNAARNQVVVYANLTVCAAGAVVPVYFESVA